MSAKGTRGVSSSANRTSGATLCALLVLFLLGCASGTPAVPPTTTGVLTVGTATPSSPTAVPLPPTSPPVSPTAEPQRTPISTIAIAVTYVPTPTSYPPQLFATATAAVAGFPASVIAAEAEGASYPRLDPPTQPPDLFVGAAGVVERRCVQVEGSGTKGIRSGGFVAGAFNYFPDTWRQHRAGKVWWVPEHALRNEPVTVRAVRLDAPTDTSRQQIKGASSAFFPSMVALPTAGT